MKPVNDISQELSSMGSMLAGLSRKMPYAVPDGYFDQLANDAHATIKDLDQPDVVPGWGKALPYSVPAGYFEGLTAKIVAAAIADELATGLPKDNLSAVPAGYFETFPDRMLTAAKAADGSKKKATIIPFDRRKMAMPVRWAAAAVLFITIGLGAFEVFYTQPAGNSDQILASVASVPNNEIQDYLQGTFRMDVDRIVGNNDVSKMQVDNKDIIDYLDETGWD